MCCGRKKIQRRKTTGRKSGRYKQQKPVEKTIDEQHPENKQ